MSDKVVSNTFQKGLEQQNMDLFSANILKSKSLYFPSTHVEIEVVNNKAVEFEVLLVEGQRGFVRAQINLIHILQRAEMTLCFSQPKNMASVIGSITDTSATLRKSLTYLERYLGDGFCKAVSYLH